MDMEIEKSIQEDEIPSVHLNENQKLVFPCGKKYPEINLEFVICNGPQNIEMILSIKCDECREWEKAFYLTCTSQRQLFPVQLPR